MQLLEHPVKACLNFKHIICSTLYNISVIIHRRKLNISFNIQRGVPRNMTVGRRHESRLSLNLFMSFSRRPTLTCMVLETKTTKFF